MSRWLVVTLALFVAAAALYVLASASGRGRLAEPEIDAASRQKLLEVLRQGEES